MAIFSDNDRSKIDDEINLDDVDEVEETPDDEVEETPDENPTETPSDDQPNTPPDPEKKETPEAKPEDTADYWKKKFTESSRENQLERERREKAEREAEEMRKPKEITDDTMKQTYPDWDNYDEGVKTALKNQAIQSQELERLKASQSEYHNERKWRGQVDSFLDENGETERYPALVKNQDAFRKFVNKPERKGMDLDILAKAFGYEAGATQEPEKKPGSNQEMLNTGSGAGATGKHKTDKKKLDADDAKRLRENNPREYERKVRSGELDIKI